jgi:hypothetical protein
VNDKEEVEALIKEDPFILPELENMR